MAAAGDRGGVCSAERKKSAGEEAADDTVAMLSNGFCGVTGNWTEEDAPADTGIIPRSDDGVPGTTSSRLDDDDAEAEEDNILHVFLRNQTPTALGFRRIKLDGDTPARRLSQTNQGSCWCVRPSQVTVGKR